MHQKNKKCTINILLLSINNHNLKKGRQMETIPSASAPLYIRCRMGHYYGCVKLLKFEFNDRSLYTKNDTTGYITKKFFFYSIIGISKKYS